MTKDPTRPGRRPLPPGERRSVHLTIALTEAEAERLRVQLLDGETRAEGARRVLVEGLST